MYQVQQINGRELAAILSTHKTIAAAVKACRSADRKPHGNLVRFEGVLRLSAVKQLRDITGCTLLQAGEAVDKTTNFEDAITFIQTRGQA